MRIIGGHDYYDGAQAYGQDREIVFSRQPFMDAVPRLQSECGLRPVDKGRLSLVGGTGRGMLSVLDRVDNRKGRYFFCPVVVWFAGTRYAGVRVSGSARGGADSVFHIWNADELRGFLASVDSRLDSDWYSTSQLSDENVDQWFADKGTQAEKDWLVSERISIAISGGPEYEWGYSNWKKGRHWKCDTDGLRDLGFAKVVPPWEAFQQLSMWIGGTIAHPGRPVVEIESDVVRRDKHGFDNLSFKKSKSGKGRWTLPKRAV